ncbi:pyocin activator PrtN family protein [Xenorhabdus siamensis]|uniref:pyocin activator PrtN family protein n=1 Tax=Xenorhabdus siamensis TaxID=3136254 RepID=UPI0030F3C63C
MRDHKLADSQKLLRIVHVNDLAAYIDKQREQAAKKLPSAVIVAPNSTKIIIN